MDLEVRHKEFSRRYETENGTLTTEGKPLAYSFSPYGNDGYLLNMNGKTYPVYDLKTEPDSISFTYKGYRYTAGIKDGQTLLLEKMGFKTGRKSSEGLLKAPMPGKILRIAVQPGDTVEPGQTLLVLEAMKMENELKSSLSGTVKQIHVSDGESVEKNATLIEIG